MRQSKFIRLINLYLDNEISAGDLQKLRAELKLSNQRRLLFNSYRRINEILPHSNIEFELSKPSRWKLYLGGTLGFIILFLLSTFIFFNSGSDVDEDSVNFAEANHALQNNLSSTWNEALMQLEAREQSAINSELSVMNGQQLINKDGWTVVSVSEHE